MQPAGKPSKADGDLTPEMRRVMRVFLLIIATIMFGGVTVAIESGQLDEADDSWSISGDSFALDVDACNVRVRFGGSKASYEMEAAPGAVGLLPSASGLTISNGRSLNERYTDFWCYVNVTLPSDFAGALSVDFADVYYSALDVYGGDLAALTVSAGDARTYVDVRLEAMTVGALAVSVGDGSVSASGVLFETATVTTGKAPVSVEAVPASGVNVTLADSGSGATCLVSAGGASEGVLLGAAPAAGSLAVQTGSGAIYVSTEDGDAAAAGSTTDAAAALSEASLDLIADALADGVEQLYVTVKGPGSPDGVWVWSSTNMYMLFSPTYLSLSSFTLLAPSTRSVQAHLSPSACPAPAAAAALDALQPIDALLRTAVGASTSDDTIFFRRDDEGGDRIMVQTEPFSGVQFVQKLAWADYDDELAVLVLVSILTFMSSIYMCYFVGKRLAAWRRGYLERFGALFFGDDWAERKAEVYEKAGPLFMAEFFVGFPHETRRPLKMVQCVLTHCVVVLVPVAPFMAAIDVYYRAEAAAQDPSLDWFPVFLLVLLVPYMCISFVYLVLYYCDASWSARRFLGVPFQGLWLLLLGWGLVFLVNSGFWLLLGALLKPEEIFPYAGAVLLLLGHTYASQRRVRKLLAELEEERRLQDEVEAASGMSTEMVENPMRSGSGSGDDDAAEEKEAAPAPTVKVTGKLTLKDSIGMLSKSALFEISAKSIKEQLFKELFSSIALVGIALFILFGFSAFGSTGLSSALSTALLFVGGGSVNFPLAMESDAEKKKAWEEEVKKAAAAEGSA